MFALIPFLITFIFPNFANIQNMYKRPNKVYLHLEKFNERYNLLHVGISFDDSLKKIRYDYRAFKKDEDYVTIESEESNELFPNMYIPTDIDDYADIEKRTIYWGTCYKSLHEIINFEKSLHKRYILGIYDCRHYVNKFSIWALNKPSPVWNLHILWYYLDPNSINNISQVNRE